MSRGRVCDNRAVEQHTRTVLIVSQTLTDEQGNSSTYRAELCQQCMDTYPVTVVRDCGRLTGRSRGGNVRKQRGFRWTDHMADPPTREGALETA